MIYLIIDSNNTFSSEVVYKALLRSFSKSQVNIISASSINVAMSPGVFVILNPVSFVLSVIPAGSKVIIFGKIDTALAQSLTVELLEKPLHLTESAVIHFTSLPEFTFPLPSRPLVRFDFAREWNNLGYGAITLDGSPWAVAQAAYSSHAIASVEGNVFITLQDYQDISILWVNRGVGLVDSANWVLIEYFVSAYAVDKRVAYAYLLDIPANCTAAVTMRLDCDESILHAEPLFDLYQQKQVPFSLAVKTSLLEYTNDVQLLKKIIQAQGAVLSHSVNHKVAWGENYADALAEAKTSKQALEYAVAQPVQFAVSPFHSNQHYSVQALENADYLGFVSGIIANDPEYLMARGGVVPFSQKMVSQSQQCMLHGDCLLTEADPLRVYKQAFNVARTSNTFFGFLDHPFSERYQYGWASEQQRLKHHSDFIDYMRTFDEVLFVNEVDCLNFMIDKSNTLIEYDISGEPKLNLPTERRSKLPIGFSFKRQVCEI